MMRVDYKAFGKRLREYRLADSLPEQTIYMLRQRPRRLRNTLTNWVLADQPDESSAPDYAVDLHLLPPLAFSAIDEELPIYS